jgi:glutamine synthetase
LSTPRSATGAQLAARDVRYARVEVPDLDGSMRAKLVSVDKALGADGVALCSIAFGLTVADDVYESPASSYANGFPDLWAHGDPAPALEAADRAARAKAYFKELCAERNLVATFMAKWKPADSGWTQWSSAQVTEWELRRYFEVT